MNLLYRDNTVEIPTYCHFLPFIHRQNLLPFSLHKPSKPRNIYVPWTSPRKKLRKFYFQNSDCFPPSTMPLTFIVALVYSLYETEKLNVYSSSKIMMGLVAIFVQSPWHNVIIMNHLYTQQVSCNIIMYSFTACRIQNFASSEATSSLLACLYAQNFGAHVNCQGYKILLIF